MIVINTRNVNRAWPVGLMHLSTVEERQKSRVGEVVAYPTPVTTVYQRPTERVLFCPQRNANPWFHLFESMWMLVGRDDPQWLDRYVSDFSSRFAEEDGRMHGAYGKRWRGIFPALFHPSQTSDQLEVLADLLRSDHTTRQAVLTMWSPQIDLLAPVLDKPCNTHVYFQPHQNGALDMTILCRSNDMIHGAYGANAVHMSVLHEYMAARAGYLIGTMYQVSNNFHAYTAVLDKMFPHDPAVGHLLRWHVEDCDLYSTEQVSATPLFSEVLSWDTFGDELAWWLDDPSNHNSSGFRYPLINDLLIPMSIVHDLVKSRNLSFALRACDNIAHSDWRLACRQWIGRRIVREDIRRSQIAAEIVP